MDVSAKNTIALNESTSSYCYALSKTTLYDIKRLIRSISKGKWSRFSLKVRVARLCAKVLLDRYIRNRVSLVFVQ